MTKKVKSGLLSGGLILAIAFIIITLEMNKAQNQNSTANNSQNGEKLKVTASFYPLYYFSSEIGKDLAQVTNITPAGAEPHDYELSSQEVKNIQSSQILILNGGKLEPWGDKIKTELSTKTIVISAGQNIINQNSEEDGQAMLDPHVWLSPSLAQEEVQIILHGFIQADPKNAVIYTKNAQNLMERLNTLHEQYQTGLADCKLRDFITAHTAFAYIARDYHLNQIGISGLSPNIEPSPTQLADLAKLAQEKNIKYVFFESLVSPKLAQTLAQEIGAQTLVLNPLEGLTTTEINQEKNYFTIMQDNLTNLRLALQCQ